MRFSVSALFLASLFVSGPIAVLAHNAQPSPTPQAPTYSCPDSDKNHQSKVEWMSDKGPHSKALFGCTFRTGHGTGTYTCTYNSKSGGCTGGGQHCPDKAYHPNQKRTPEAAPATPVGRHAARQLHQAKLT